ncbi:hypothetical protein GKODMF_06085 [Candidatus Electrothrix gigas]
MQNNYSRKIFSLQADAGNCNKIKFTLKIQRTRRTLFRIFYIFERLRQKTPENSSH